MELHGPVSSDYGAQFTPVFEGKEKNFKVNEGDTQNLVYDKDSIMHYGQ